MLEKSAVQIESSGKDKKQARRYPLTSLYFYLTAGCNLACRHCWLAPGFQDEKRQYPMLDFELMKRIIDQAAPLGLSSVKLTGGEPLMHPRIVEILDFLLQRKLELLVETNVLLCTPELAEKMAQFERRHISVSLDGVDAATHDWVRGVKGAFVGAVAGINNLTAAGVRPQIIMSLLRINYKQAEAMVRFAEELGCGSVKFNLVQPTKRGEQIYMQDQGLHIEDYVRLGKKIENELASQTKMIIYYDHPFAFRPLHRLFGNGSQANGRCGILSILGVLADGSYALCGIGASVPEMIFGNACCNDLAAIWHEHPVLQELRAGLPARLQGICGACMMKSICMASCIAQNYYRNQSLWAPFWFCEGAEAQGLFPASRKQPQPNHSYKESEATHAMEQTSTKTAERL